jgi:hypothetical protein
MTVNTYTKKYSINLRILNLNRIIQYKLNLQIQQILLTVAQDF